MKHFIFRQQYLEVVPKMRERYYEIMELIEALPESIEGDIEYEICSAARKQLYCLQLESRLQFLERNMDIAGEYPSNIKAF